MLRWRQSRCGGERRQPKLNAKVVEGCYSISLPVVGLVWLLFVIIYGT